MSENLYPSQLKLVIWDLDGTFWEGILSETGVTPNTRNIDLVASLTDRGIVNSICSNNNFDQAKQAIEEIGIWDLFVFPRIDWTPKGLVVQEIVSTMGLRPEDCIFIDDLESNRQEVSDKLPGLWVYSPEDILEKLRDLSIFPGRMDLRRQRLSHYKILESRSAAINSVKCSNVDFLRESGIEVVFDFSPKESLERVFELIERTNQLNFTKKRLNTDAERKDFVERLDFFQTQAALIYCRDRFGDHGPVGFFMMRTTAHGRSLEHFLFSCRILNMGLESFVYEFLRRPRIKVVEPVAYDLDLYGGAPWIRRRDASTGLFADGESFDGSNILLLGPCHLLQTSSYLGRGTLDFLHEYRGNYLIKFDCPGFFLSSRSDVENSRFLERGVSWSKDDYIRFHDVLPSAKMVVLDLGDFSRFDKLAKIDGLLLRPTWEATEVIPDLQYVSFDFTRRLELVREVVDFVCRSTGGDVEILMLNRAFNRKTAKGKLATELAFDHLLRSIRDPKVRAVDCNTLVNHADFDGGGHMPRAAYFALSEIINGRSEVPDNPFDYSLFHELIRSS